QPRHGDSNPLRGVFVPETPPASSHVAEREPDAPRLKAPAGTLYRGDKVGMWSWVLHRITGVGIFFFLLVHVLDTALIRVGPEAYNVVIDSYKNPIMGIGEVGLVGAVGLHALNGIRIILVDFWSWGTKHQRFLFWIVVALWLVLMI